MAGGEGARLRPLTCDLPKPMARLLGRPVLEYILELLARHGIMEAALTVRYLPGRIVEHFPDRVFSGVRLRFVEEDEPLGTAGGVKNACMPQDEDVLVISGDAMCDFDLSAFVKHHKLSGADVSILGKAVGDPREYGLIDIEESGRVRGFIEKPAYSQAVSDIANTGIYILSRRAVELIPDGKPYDFAKDLFPFMLERGMLLSCMVEDAYWCDIGDLGSYIQCQQDMLHGLVQFKHYASRDAQGNLLAGKMPFTTTAIVPPCYIGRHVKIEESAIIESGSVIDDGCYIGSGARITTSVLLKDCYVARRAKLTGALLCATANVGAGAMLFEGATVGAGAVVGENATVNAGVKIWNKKRVEPSMVVSEHIKTAAQAREFFDDNGIAGQIGVELTPEFAARVGAAVGSFAPGGRIAVGCSAHPGANVLKSALSAGIRSTGTDVVDFGDNFQVQFEFAMNFCAVPVGVYIRGDNHAGIKLFDAGGLPATREMERGVEGILTRGEFTRSAHDDTGEHIPMHGLGPMYKSQLMRAAGRGLSGCSARVKSHNLPLKGILSETLYKLGCDVEGGPVLEMSSQGDKVRVYDPALGYIQHHSIFTWCCLSELERGEDIAVPFDAPRVIDAFAQDKGRQVLRYYQCPADDGDRAARALAKRQLWTRDALMQSIMFLSIARRMGGVSAILAQAPRFERIMKTLETSQNPAPLIRALDGAAGGDGRVSEGVLLRERRGIVLVRPLKRGTGVRIFAESVNSETAQELCDDIEALIRKNMK